VNRKKRIKLLFVALLFGNLNQVLGQSIQKIRQELILSGFENLRILQSDGKLSVSIENVSYRWQVHAISQALDIISTNLSEAADLEIFMLDNSIPRIVIRVKADDWKNYRNGSLSSLELSSRLSISSALGDEWNTLKNLDAENRSSGKIDLVLYPQFAFKNTLLRKPYEVQLNVAPALEVSLLKGMKLTGQVILPIINELGYEGGFVRPGYVTISQDFRLADRWLARATAGNFSETRYGFDVSMKHPFANENWAWQGNASFTGSSHFFDYTWTRSPVNTLSWSSSVSYYYPRYNLELKAGAARYYYEDHGLFASCTRYFGETAFGFYAMLGENSTNGGFHVTIPFPAKKRSARKFVRLTIPEHYEMTYNAGTEFYYGQSFRTRPDQNRIHDTIFPDYIKQHLIHLK